MGYDFNIEQLVKTGMVKLTVVRTAEQYLGVLGVTVLDQQRWEAAQFEMDTCAQLGQTWSYRKLACRYLELLKDKAKSSSLNNNNETN
jgi:hypothetical protein